MSTADQAVQPGHIDPVNEDITVLLPAGMRYAGNPYMRLLTTALEANGVDIRHCENSVLFPVTRSVLRHRSADIVHLDWLHSYYSITDLDSAVGNRILTVIRSITFFVDIVLASLLPVRIVWTVHNKTHHERRNPRTERIVNELVFFRADAITVKCENAVRILESHYTAARSQKMHIVPDGSYIPAYQNNITKADARDALSIHEDEFVYLFFGQIRPYKGVPDLVSAYVELQHPDTSLWIVGNPKPEELRRALTKQVDHRGDITVVFDYVPAESIQQYMNAADVLVLPYRDVLNSGAAYAGLSFGLPIIAPAIGCLPEIFPTENVFLYDPARPGALFQELTRVYHHPDLASIGQANYEHARNQTWSGVATELTNVYQTVLES